MSGSEWALVALGAAGAGGALVALDAAVIRRRRRRRNELVRPPGRNQPQLRERRIEIVEIDDARSSSTQDSDP